MTQNQTLSSRAWGELLLLALIWGGSFLAMRITLNEVGVFTTVAHRIFWAAFILWGVVLYRGISIPGSGKIWGAFFVMGALNNAIPFALFAWGQLYIETGLTSILNGATAPFGILLAALFFKDEPITLRRGIGVVLGFLGMAITLGLENLQEFNIKSLAQLAILGATFSYALAGSWARAQLGHLPSQLSAAGMVTAATLIMVPLAWYFEGPFDLTLMPSTWMAIFYMTVFATALAYLLYYRVLSMAGSGNLMLCTLLIPPVAVILGSLVLGEALHFRAFIGFGVLALGMFILDGRLEQYLRRRFSV
ncbi:transmembrane drug/metabolite transporter family protein [Rhodobacterales bacterium HTCC2150]|nr:transmembrane drug/metabolite transporter family protein [Rhodobacterales bacterium HTCC2150] [Rhodobacteraceae bacterium HTCC2150]